MLWRWPLFGDILSALNGFVHIFSLLGNLTCDFYILFPRTNEQSSVVESFTIYNVVTVLSVPSEFYWLEGAIKIQFVIM